MKDADLGRPSSDHRAARGSRPARIRLPEPAGERRGRPAAQTKLRPVSRVSSVRPRTGRDSGTPTRATALWGAGHPPPQPPARRRRPAPALGRAGARAWAGVPARRRPHALPAPAGSRPARASPPPAGPSGRGKQRSRRRSARRARRAGLPADPSPAAGPRSPSPPRSPRAGGPRPLDGRPRGAGASGARRGRLGPHSPLQHQDDGEPLGNLAESGAMQTLELRCGHSMATGRAARRTEARGPGEVGAEGLGRLRLGSLLAGRSADGGCVPSPCVKESKSFRAPGFLARRLQKPRSGERVNPGSEFCRHP